MKGLFRRTRRVHFVGIGGIGMSGIAEVLLNLGYEVTGSDLRESATTHRLVQLGAQVAKGHRPENVEGCHVVVTSSAVRTDNPEVVAANERGIPVIPRAEMLAELMRMKHGLAIAGSHGKTTTTSMLAHCLAAGNLDPTVVVGGRLNSLDSNAKLGDGDYLVAEADESDGSFLKLSPTIAVVTNIDPEHLDHYGDFESLRSAFIDFINKVPFYGAAVICLDHPVIQQIIPRIHKRYITYGLSSQAEVHAVDLKFDGGTSQFTVMHHDRWLGTIELQMPGRHNVLNALAAVAASLEVDIPFKIIRRALEGFDGVARRFTVRGSCAGVTVIDDYGHHPVEIRSTLEAAREGFGRRVISVFQPHRYSRIAALKDDFMSAFNDTDLLVVTDIYAAGEAPIEGVSGEALYRGLREHGYKNAVFIPEREKIVDFLRDTVNKGDIVITLGAGDISQVADELLAVLADGDGD
jgi:UDP-N-acetylmuramate--alanine ligase